MGTAATLRVLVADDHEVVRKGLRTILEEQPGWEVSGEASDGREAVDKVRALKPDVTVVDVGMPGLNGLEATRQMLKNDPETKVLILTMHESDPLIREVLDAGARGYLLKSDRGNTPRQYHAPLELPFGKRIGALRDPKQHNRCVAPKPLITKPLNNPQRL